MPLLRLRDVELIADRDQIEQRRRCFQNVASRRARRIDQAKGPRKCGVHHPERVVQPEGGDREKDKEHVNGRRGNAGPAFDEEQSFVCGQAAAKSQPAQAAHKTAAPLDAAKHHPAPSAILDHKYDYTTVRHRQTIASVRTNLTNLVTRSIVFPLGGEDLCQSAMLF